ncbi:phosphate/phosphite/phosphonate ABC transporter substrate-binding protein [Leucobacter allii]|uniref:phosphate/phosphite/phosphonate ABC transporter substrate-binding protein n=1 Tax=Leucobacter allii TaxID=2932247 RepID=UPI001FD27F21|nr:phosphate/phosphite/phosphonate ABC transporter substrate-binding protein [Leucobacter allii]UOR01919.1 phosphate/phosphite/phosphonate ABC transporter substrate-binding protein [Leucobacter allii]
MRKSLPALAAILSAGLLLTACGQSPNARTDDAAGGDPSELVFAVVPTDDSSELEKSFEPVVAAIEEATGIPTSIQAVSTNSGVIEAQVAERVDIATYGAFSYYLASSVADVTPVAMDQRTPEPGSGAVQSYGVVAAGSDIAEIADVAGANVCFTDPASTTGYLTAAVALQEAGIDPESEITPVFVGSHDVAVTQMLAGDCDVAFVAGTFIDDILPARGVISEGDTSTIWKSDGIPGTPIVLGDWLSDDLRAQITEAVTGTDAVQAHAAGLCETQTREAPPEWGEEYVGETACLWGGTQAFAFEPADDETYAVISDICSVLDADVCRGEEA